MIEQEWTLEGERMKPKKEDQDPGLAYFWGQYLERREIGDCCCAMLSRIWIKILKIMFTETHAKKFPFVPFIDFSEYQIALHFQFVICVFFLNETLC